MKKRIVVSVLAAGSLLFASGAMAAEQTQGQQQREQEKQEYSQQQKQQQTRQEQGESEYARQLMTLNELEGMKIKNRQGDEIGSVDKVVLDSKAGQVAYVVVTSGGFWGVGGEKAVIPWKAVSFEQPTGQVQAGETDEQFLTVDVSKEQLMNAPQGDIQQVLDRQQAQQIHQHYGVAPYWEGQQEQQKPEGQMQQMQEKMQQQKEGAHGEMEYQKDKMKEEMK